MGFDNLFYFDLERVLSSSEKSDESDIFAGFLMYF